MISAGIKQKILRTCSSKIDSAASCEYMNAQFAVEIYL